MLIGLNVGSRYTMFLNGILFSQGWVIRVWQTLFWVQVFVSLERRDLRVEELWRLESVKFSPRRALTGTV